MTLPDISFRKLLGEWSSAHRSRNQSRWPTELPGTFQPTRTLRAAVEVQKRLGDDRIKPPDPVALEELYARAIKRLRRNIAIENWPRRDLRRLPWVFFHTPKSRGQRRSRPSGIRLGDTPQLVRSYGAWLLGSRARRPALSLLHEFLRVYPTGSSSFAEIRGMLIRAIHSDRETASLRRWRERCEAFHLLDPKGDLACVEALISGGTPVTAKLENAGFDASLATAGILKTGLRKALGGMEERLEDGRADPDRLDRILEILQFGDELRFTDLRKTIAESLLGPFLNKEPDSPTRERILSFHMRHFGHPGLPAGKRNWHGVPSRFRDVVLRWLVAQSLDAFFAVVKETALDRHWKYREKFWRAHFEAGLIDRAWFVLGPRAQSLVKAQRDLEESAMGALLGGPKDQSVLLLHIRGKRGMTISEWSHSGACRIWFDENPEAPRLYETEYQREDSRPGRSLWGGEDHRRTHHGSEAGRWQDDLAGWIQDDTATPVERSDYLPESVASAPSSSRSRPEPAPHWDWRW